MKIEGYFYISASTEDIAISRDKKFSEITGFTDVDGWGICEQLEGPGLWKIETSGFFDSIEGLKNSLKKMEEYEWFYLHDSRMYLENELIFSNGEWLV